MTTRTSIDELCINTLRTLAMDAVQKANSGHPGTPMGAAPVAYVIWTRFLKHNPADPKWPDRDRFVLSAGHASMLLYALLHLTGYDLPIEELQNFRQWGSRTPGHPEYGLTPGVEATTGPLGQGFAMGIGMAIAEHFLGGHFNRGGRNIVDHYVYGLVSDGDLMEGIASEAASLAGTLKLGKLVYVYDRNEITIEGSTNLAFKEDVGKRFEAYGWHVDEVNGNDLDAIEAAVQRAREETERPSLIISHSTIAWGSPNKAGSADTHGAPLGEDEVRATKRALGWPEDAHFYEPDEAVAEFRKALERGQQRQAEWQQRFDAFEREEPELAKTWRAAMAQEQPEGWDADLPVFEGDPVATRAASGKVLNSMIKTLPTLVGGSADLAPSTNTYLAEEGDLGLDDWRGHNMHFGVREHAMGGIVNGMAVHGGVIAYGATFLTFSDYMRPAIRIAALMESRSIFIFTHDSVGLGEDGPTHQPIEHLMSLRAMPRLTVLRPADANETTECWKLALRRKGPVTLALTRQSLPVLGEVERMRAGVRRGAYVLADSEGRPDVILVATGSEVSVALKAREKLSERGIRGRVVSMPSWEVFEEQDGLYRDQVLPPDVRARVSVEAGTVLGWRKYVGDLGDSVGIDQFGASAPGKVALEKLGFTADNVAERAVAVIERVRRGDGSRER